MSSVVFPGYRFPGRPSPPYHARGSPGQTASSDVCVLCVFGEVGLQLASSVLAVSVTRARTH